MSVQSMAIAVLLVSFLVMILLRFPIAYAVALSSLLCLLSQGLPLTTICQPKEEMARASIKMLLDLIEEHPVKNNQQIFKAELRPGESTQKI